MTPRRPARTVSVARVYEAPTDEGASRLLVDRLWPRGVRKEGAPFDEWHPEVAPSTALRRFYGHQPERFAAFRERYLGELETDDAEAFAALVERAKHGPLVLLTATKDAEHSGAAVLAEALLARLNTRGASPKTSRPRKPSTD